MDSFWGVMWTSEWILTQLIGAMRNKHHLLNIKWWEKTILKVNTEERLKGTGFMSRMKRRWDEIFSDRGNVSKLNLRDNALRFKTEMKNGQRKKAGKDIEIDNINKENTTTVINKNNNEWTLDINENLAKVDRAERKKGKVFMKRSK